MRRKVFPSALCEWRGRGLGEGGGGGTVGVDVEELQRPEIK